jgi:hypothetical protein
MNHARPSFDILRELSPEERIHFLRDHLDACINLTPTGPEGNAMSEANIVLIEAQGKLEAARRAPFKQV